MVRNPDTNRSPRLHRIPRATAAVIARRRASRPAVPVISSPAGESTLFGSRIASTRPTA